MFKKLFGKGNKSKTPKGFFDLTIKSIEKLTADTVKVTLDVPSELKTKFSFTPGQYINFSVTINGNEERRSYSICSGKNEDLSVAVKQVEGGKVSTWFNQSAEVNTPIFVSSPEGNFTRSDNAKNIVAIAAGSGITPIMSIAKDIEQVNGSLQLFFGSRTKANILFKDELESLTKTKTTHYLSAEQADDCQNGRIDKSNFSEIIKGNLDLLKSDGFYICGPEQMISDVSESLALFGVNEDKIHYELFTAPTILKSAGSTQESTFSGISKVKAILDDEEITFELSSDGDTLLDKVNNEGFDAPYSCRGGVCCSCKAKVLEGKATMKLNYALSEQEVKEGFILTCQAQPASETLVISYDD